MLLYRQLSPCSVSYFCSIWPFSLLYSRCLETKISCCSFRHIPSSYEGKRDIYFWNVIHLHIFLIHYHNSSRTSNFGTVGTYWSYLTVFCTDPFAPRDLKMRSALLWDVTQVTVSEQPLGTIFKDQEVEEDQTLYYPTNAQYKICTYN